MSQDSQDIGKQTMDQIGQGAAKGLKNKYVRKALQKGLKVLLKILKFIMQKVVLAVIKALLAFFGPYVLAILLVIILLFIVIDSVVDFDVFQRGAERTPAEELFDKTVREVIIDRTSNIPNSLSSQLASQQSQAPYPAVSESWLGDLEKQMTPSWALTGTLYYYNAIKSKSFKSFHNKYSKVDISSKSKRNKAITDFRNDINKEYDYYFKDSSMTMNVSYGRSSGEYKVTKSTTSCTRPPSEGEDPPPLPTVTSTTTKSNLPSRSIVTGADVHYIKNTFNYKLVTGEWTDGGTTTSGDCTTSTQIQYTLYLLDEATSGQPEYDANTMISFLLIDAPEGKFSRLVKIKDLQFIMDLGEQMDDSFPKLTIEYEKLIKCAKKDGIAGCISEYVTGTFNNSYLGFYSWYPGNYRDLYQAAGDAFDVDWWLIASLHAQETTFSTNPVATDPAKGSSAGAKGHFQFMGLTWLGWGFKGGNGLTVSRLGNIMGPVDVMVKFISDPSQIARFGGFGMDANKNGLSSPWEIEDAAFTASKYIKANGYQKGNEAAIKKAIRAYNHSTSYVNEVYNRGIKFRDGVASVPGGVVGGGSGGNSSVVTIGNRWIGNSVYVFGGGRNQNDIARGRFDCSSFVHWAFNQVGKNLGSLGSTSTETLKKLGTAVPTNQMQPGDLVFFDTYKKDGHVGIYVGDGKFIGAQSSTGVAIANMSSGYWAQKFNGRVKRI